jgi:hypothetical protein
MRAKARKNRDDSADVEPDFCSSPAIHRERPHSGEYDLPACYFPGVPAATVKLTHYASRIEDSDIVFAGDD